MENKVLQAEISRYQNIIDEIENHHNVNINPVYNSSELKAMNHAEEIVNADEMKLNDNELA